MLRHFDAFAGIGGFSLAASWTNGIETIAYCEIDKFCQKVLRKNFGKDIVIFDDIKTLTENELGCLRPIDLFTGGFPCQPYSIAGKRRGDSDDRALWREMLRVIEILQPTWIVGENVAHFVNMALDQMLTDLESQGYETQPFLIPASGVDAWHTRYRTFVVAHTKSKQSDRRECRFLAQTPQRRKGSHSASGISSEDDSNTPSEGLERHGRHRQIESTTGNLRGDISKIPCDDTDPNSRRRQQCNAGQRTISIPNQGSAWAEHWSTVAARFCRMDDVVPNRVDRLRGLGNAVVPYQVYPILQAIVDIENGLREIP